MLRQTLLPLLVLAAVASAPAVGAAGDLVTVTLNVDHGDLPTFPADKACDVEVPEGADALVVLDAAVEADCISGYEATYYESYDAYFVDSIDGVRGVPAWPAACTYWAFYVDGAYADYGVDGYTATEGSTVGFAYEDCSLIGFLLPA